LVSGDPGIACGDNRLLTHAAGGLRHDLGLFPHFFRRIGERGHHTRNRAAEILGMTIERRLSPVVGLLRLPGDMDIDK
jgi:hypothetical protein